MSREREPDQRLVKGWFCSGLSNLTTRTAYRFLMWSFFSYLYPRRQLRLRESPTTSLTSLPVFINLFRFASWAVF